MATTQRSVRVSRKQLIILVLAIIALYVIIPQLGNFRHSISLVPQANRNDLALAIVFTALSYVAAAGTYYLLALEPIRYARTLLVQIAGMFMNRLLPAGIGGISINYIYLTKSKHTGTQAASVVAANNALGVLGNGLLIGVLLLFFNDQLPHMHLFRSSRVKLLALATVLVLVALLAAYKYFGKRFTNAVQSFWRQLLGYRERPGHLVAALTCSMALTLSNVVSFWLCVQAVHSDLAFLPVLLVFSFGVALGSAIPTPGGLGGVEAGMVAGLIAYGVDSSIALAAVLIYRLISYWLPLIVGAISFALTDKRGYI